MKCAQCGVENSEQSNFCYKCGQQLTDLAKCGKCGGELRPDDKFCTICGAKARVKESSASRPGPVAAKYKKSRKQRAPRRNQKGRRKKRGPLVAVAMVIALVSIAAVLVGLALASGAFNGSPRIAVESRGYRNLNTGSGANIAWDRDVQVIASNFLCPCGKCGVTPLDQCTCDAPKGSKEVKRYIRTLLRQGLGAEDIIGKVELKYGHRI